jgi:hypothetical protein
MNRPHKYGAKAVQLGTERFASKREAKRFTELQLLERAGEITNLQKQVPVFLVGQNGPLFTRTGRKMRLTFDFCYTEDGFVIYEDSKGAWTRDFEVRLAVAHAMGIRTRIT